MKNYWAVLLLLCMVTACKDFSNKPKFSISAPFGWTRTDSIDERGDTVVRLKSPLGVASINPSKNVRETIALLVMHDRNSDPQRLSVLKNLKGRAIFFEQTGSGHKVIDGISSYWFEINVKYKSSMLLCTQRHYFLPKDGFVYTFICTCSKEDFEAIRSQVDEVLNSFKVLDD